MTLFSTSALRSQSARAAFSCTTTDADDRSAMRGRMPPADATVTLFAFDLCHKYILYLYLYLYSRHSRFAQCARSMLLHADQR